MFTALSQQRFATVSRQGGVELTSIGVGVLSLISLSTGTKKEGAQTHTPLLGTIF